MTNTEKRINLNSIRNCLSVEQIPFEYNAQDLVIKLKGIDMTDVLLAVHDYNSEKMTDLIKENAELDNFIMQSKKDGISPINALIIKNLGNQLTKAKEIMQKLIANAPDTYSGTNIELQQRKMFSFQDAINKAEQFLKESEE